MFNVAAEKGMIARTEVMDGKIQKTGSSFSPWTPTAGVYCLTFNKLAYRIIKPGSSSDAGGSSSAYSGGGGGGASAFGDVPELEDQLPSATEIMMLKPLINAFDWILTDEGQDVTGKYSPFSDELIKWAKHVIVAGDPRQEIYSGARWFSDLYANCTEEQRFILRYNHRSHPYIVEALNTYSRFCFDTLHHDQIAARPLMMTRKTKSVAADGKLMMMEKKKKSPDPPKEEDAATLLLKETREYGVHVVSCNRDDLAFCIAAELMKYPPTSVYIMTKSPLVH